MVPVFLSAPQKPPTQERGPRYPGSPIQASQPGNYYVTICTDAKQHLFGYVVEGEMHRNELGDYVALCWEWLARRYPYVDLDEWIIMPNHCMGSLLSPTVAGHELGRAVQLPPVRENRWDDWSAPPSKPCPPTASTNGAEPQAVSSGNGTSTTTSSAMTMS